MSGSSRAGGGGAPVSKAESTGGPLLCAGGFWVIRMLMASISPCARPR